MDERPKKSVFGTAPPPHKEDKLFRADSEWVTNACVNYTHNSTYLYSHGYRTAARSLAEQVCETRQKQDALIYPIVYLYRHHIELILKSIILNAVALLDRQLAEEETRTLGQHKLTSLWALLRPLLNPICNAAGNEEFPVEDLDGIDSYILQLHEHDPDGQRFRYATTNQKKKRGKIVQASTSSLNSDLKLINIRVFANALEVLADYLEGIEFWFSNLLESKLEAQNDFY